METVVDRCQASSIDYLEKHHPSTNLFAKRGNACILAEECNKGNMNSWRSTADTFLAKDQAKFAAIAKAKLAEARTTHVPSSSSRGTTSALNYFFPHCTPLGCA